MVDRFISEKQLEEERASGIPQRKPAPAPAKPLYEQLRENREKADEEFQEKIKFRMLPQLNCITNEFPNNRRTKDIGHRRRNIF